MEYFSINNLSKDRFKEVANHLLNSCFLLKRNGETQADYNYVNLNREIFKQYFDLLGYELIFNEDFGVVTIKNIEGTGRIRLKKAESVILLILRLLYIEKKSELSQSNDVIVIIDEVIDKYNMLKLSQKLDKALLRSSFGTFRKYNLINILDSDAADPETRILIWPSILLAITTESVEDAYNEAKIRLEQYSKGSDNDEQDINEN